MLKMNRGAAAFVACCLGAVCSAADEQALCGEFPPDLPFDMEIRSADPEPGSAAIPPHCRIVAHIPDAINFELRLPAGWNGKFLMVGNGGYLGAFFDQSYGLSRGYATASTDTGHTGPDPAFALNNRGAEIDFAYRAVHLTAQAAQSLTETHYGRPPQYSYFRGCSTGGRQGLIEAQRFPDDFDGWSIGAPIYDYTKKQTYNAAWTALAMFGDERAGYVPYEKLRALGAAVYRHCDAIDGLEDGLIDDPRECAFDPRQHLAQCPQNEDRSDCFTPRQIESIAKVYSGPGKHRYPGHAKGAEWLDGPMYEVRGGWDTYITGIAKPPARAINNVGQMGEDPYGGDKFVAVQLRNARSFFRYFVFDPDRPDFDVLTDLNFAKLPDMTAIAELMDAEDPDLGKIHEGNKRIILWHGWADVGLNPLRTIQYYETVQATMGRDRTDEIMRLFMVPGMYHCEGGPGPDVFDDLSALEGWVERGVAPDMMIAYKTADANGFYPNRAPAGHEREHVAIIRSRPLCRFPLVARYKGSGNVDRADNFRCARP